MSELGSDGSNVTFNPQKTATIKNGDLYKPDYEKEISNQNNSPFQEIPANINVNEIKDGLNAKDANNENLSQHSSVQYVFDSKKKNELIASNAEMKESIKDMSSSINNMTKSINEMIGSNVETRNVMKEAVDEMKKNNFNQKQLLGILFKRLFPEKKNLIFPLQPQNLNQTQPIIQPQLAQSQVIQITMKPQNPINF